MERTQSPGCWWWLIGGNILTLSSCIVKIIVTKLKLKSEELSLYKEIINSILMFGGVKQICKDDSNKGHEIHPLSIWIKEKNDRGKQNNASDGAKLPRPVFIGRDSWCNKSCPHFPMNFLHIYRIKFNLQVYELNIKISAKTKKKGGCDRWRQSIYILSECPKHLIEHGITLLNNCMYLNNCQQASTVLSFTKLTSVSFLLRGAWVKDVFFCVCFH